MDYGGAAGAIFLRNRNGSSVSTTRYIGHLSGPLAREDFRKNKESRFSELTQTDQPIANVRESVIESLPSGSAGIRTERLPSFEDVRLLEVC